MNEKQILIVIIFLYISLKRTKLKWCQNREVDCSHFATHLPIKGNTFDTFMNDKKEDIIIFFLLSFLAKVHIHIFY